MRMTRSWKRSWSWLDAALILLVISTGAVRADPTPDPKKLRNLVVQDCGSCHGLTLQGGLGKPLTVDALAAWDREQLAHIILNGVPGTPMPPWGPLLSEAEARWIADALKRGILR